jgi:hypothetical protein
MNKAIINNIGPRMNTWRNLPQLDDSGVMEHIGQREILPVSVVISK